MVMLAQGFVAVGCSRERQGAAGGAGVVWGREALGVRCGIDVERGSVWRSGELVVGVRIENVSEDRAEFECIPAFKMAGCWCPVDLRGKRLGGREHLALGPGEGVTFKTDLSTLLWDHEYSSVWPSRAFEGVVPAGRHELQLEVEVVGASDDDGRWIRSNAVGITIGE